MAVQGPFQVVFEQVFPHGLLAVHGGVQELADFAASTRERSVQQRDRDTGLPIWVVDVLDCDPKARERNFKVKIISDHEPVLPDPIPGAPVCPVRLEGLTVTPYLKETGMEGRQKVAYSLRATGVSAPGRSAAGVKAA